MLPGSAPSELKIQAMCYCFTIDHWYAHEHAVWSLLPFKPKNHIQFKHSGPVVNQIIIVDPWRHYLCWNILKFVCNNKKIQKGAPFRRKKVPVVKKATS